MANQFRGEYDVLNQLAGTFSQQADAIQGMTQRVKSSFNTLQGGKWKGKGSKKFFDEMNNSVVPACKRLEQALSQAASVTKKIANVAKTAEEQSSGCFHI